MRGAAARDNRRTCVALLFPSHTTGEDQPSTDHSDLGEEIPQVESMYAQVRPVGEPQVDKELYGPSFAAWAGDRFIA